MTSIKHVIATIAKLWPNPAWPEDAQMIYAQAIADLDAEKLLLAVQAFYTTDAKGFRPVPGRLRALVEPDTEARALHAYAAFRRTVDEIACRPAGEPLPNFPDPRLQAAVEALGGFRQFLGGIDAKESDFLRHRFLRAYAQAGRKPLALPDAQRVPALDGRGPGPDATRGLLVGFPRRT